MALSDPQSITIGSAISLPRVITADRSSVYQSGDGVTTLSVSQSLSSTRLRTLCRVDRLVVAADPITAVNKSVKGSMYLVSDFPLANFGFSEADKIAIFTGLTGNLTASTNANLKAILGGQV